MSIKFKQPIINLRKLFNDFYCHTHPEYINKFLSNKNIIINPIFLINQRGFDGNWSGLTDTAFGYDRWRKLGTDIVQPIEDDNYQPDTIYTLSGINIKETQLLSPASGTWEITVPNTANEIKLEKGDIKTVFIYPDAATELTKCQRYYYQSTNTLLLNARRFATIGAALSITNIRSAAIVFPVSMRVAPNLKFYPSEGGANGQWNYYDGVWIAADVGIVASMSDGFQANFASLTGLTEGNAYLVYGNYTADAEL